MKNSKNYSKKILALHRTLRRKHPKVQEVRDEEVTDAIICAIVGSEMSEKAAIAAVKKLAGHFVDWNDLRVSQTEEIIDVLHKDTRTTRKVASTLVEVLNSIFNQHHGVDLAALKKTGKRPARQALEKIDGISRFVVDYCMLTSLHGHAIPLTERMLEYLKHNKLVDQNADEQQAGGFLAKQIPAKNGYDFYALLRRESESAKPVKKKKEEKKEKQQKRAKAVTNKKAKAKTKTKKKVTKKKTVRRKKA